MAAACNNGLMHIYSVAIPAARKERSLAKAVALGNVCKLYRRVRSQEMLHAQCPRLQKKWIRKMRI